MSLEYLDLRHNIFNEEGLGELIKSLSENCSIRHLYLESMRFGEKEAKLLADFFKLKDCRIEELELNEADITLKSFDIIMDGIVSSEAFFRRLSLSKNLLDVTICEHLRDFPKKLNAFESLVLSHCELGAAGLKLLCEGLYG